MLDVLILFGIAALLLLTAWLLSYRAPLFRIFSESRYRTRNLDQLGQHDREDAQPRDR